MATPEMMALATLGILAITVLALKHIFERMHAGRRRVMLEARWVRDPNQGDE